MKESRTLIQEMCHESSRDFALATFEKHGGVFRNSYGNGLTVARPDAVFGDTVPWSDNQPEGVFSLEGYNLQRGQVTEADREQALADGVSYLRKLGRPVVLYSWFATPETRRVAEQLDQTVVVARDEVVCQVVEDKSQLREHLQAAGCCTARTPCSWSCANATELPDYDATVEQFGEHFVVQGRSMGGDGTKIIDSRSDYDAAQRELRGAIRVSEFIDAPYKSVYCLSVPKRDQSDVAVYVDGPSHKPVDITELGTGKVAGAGGDWRLPHSAYDAEKLTDDITQLARHFYKQYGYHGAFVVEGFMRDGEFLFNEINARPGGGSEANGDYQLEQGMPPFPLLHLLSKLGRVSAEDIGDPGGYNACANDRAIKGADGGVFYLKYKNATDRPVQASDAYRGSGVYRLDEDGLLRWQNDGITSRSANFAAGEILVSNGPVAGDALVAAGKQICSLEAWAPDRRPVFTTDGKLDARVTAMVRAASKLLTR